MKALKSEEKVFIFHLKSSFCSQDIYIFVLTILVILKKRLDKKDKVNFKIFNITTWLTITIHILCNISQSKGIPTIKFGQYYNITEIFFSQNHGENQRDHSRTLFFKKLYMT